MFATIFLVAAEPFALAEVAGEAMAADKVRERRAASCLCAVLQDSGR